MLTAGAYGALEGNARAELRGIAYGIALTDSVDGMVDGLLEDAEQPPELPDDDSAWEWADMSLLASVPVDDDPDAETYDEIHDEGDEA